MRLLKKNKIPFYYATYLGKESFTDEYGNETGEYTLSYSEPILCTGNLSPAMGELNTRYFGESEGYDKVLLLDIDTPINEYSILWIDTLPIPNQSIPHDYVVKKVAKSLNHLSIAVSKVSVSL